MRVPYRVAGLAVIAACVYAAPASAAATVTITVPPVPAHVGQTGTSVVTVQISGATSADTLIFSAAGGTVSSPTSIPLFTGQTSATTTFTSSALTGRSVTASIGASSDTYDFSDDVPLTVYDLLHDAAGNLVAVIHAGDTPTDPSSCVFTWMYNDGLLMELRDEHATLNASGNCVATIPIGLPPGDWQLTASASEQDGDAAVRGDRFTVAAPPPSPGSSEPPPAVAPQDITPHPIRVDANQSLLQCAKSDVAITDISKRSGHVRILGVASPPNAGHQVQVAFSKSSNIVATAIVAADGSFRATAPIPRSAIATTNSARYQARVGTSTTPWLKLTRRLTLSGLHAAEGDLEVGGRISNPRIKGATVTVTTQSNCNAPPVVIAHLPVDVYGSFADVVSLPETVTGIVVRLTARVRSPHGGLFTTYSIARPVQVR